MALEIETDDEGGAVVTATERLCLTEDERLVPEGDPDARWLFCVPGQEIPRAEAERYGMVKKKAAAKPADKAAKPPANK
jgi:hypothetical protein